MKKFFTPLVMVCYFIMFFVYIITSNTNILVNGMILIVFGATSVLVAIITFIKKSKKNLIDVMYPILSCCVGAILIYNGVTKLL